MIVCVCKALSDRHIRAAVDDGATCMRDLTCDLGVGTCCIQKNEEKPIDLIEDQLGLIDKMGLQNYIQTATGALSESGSA